MPARLSIRTVRLTAALLVLAAAIPAHAAQRREQQTETKTGKIVEVKQKGRGRLLVVEIDGKEHDVPVTPKLDLQIKATGDAGFVRPGQFLSATAVMSNEKLFIKELTIRPARKGQKLPPGRIEKAEAEAGQSTAAYDVSGLITATQQNPDYPDHLDVALKSSGVRAPIMIEPDFKVSVNISDPALIPANADADVEVATLRGNRINIVGVTVQLPDPLEAAEFFGDEPETDETPKSDKATAGK